MIIPSLNDIQTKLGVPADDHSPTTRARTPPPPIHPALQYGVAASAASPPGYQTLRKPSSSVVYTFWPQLVPSNSMVLSAPPSDQDGPRPLYFISVSLNCFTPSSYVTSIRRGSWEGEFVGDFEIGLTTSKKVPTVCIRGNEYPLSDILETSYRPFRNSWLWRSFDHDKPLSLFWDESSAGGVITCFSSREKTPSNVLAKFTVPVHLRKNGRPSEMTRLEVSPQGHEYFEDILMSALILERMRTTPST